MHLTIYIILVLYSICGIHVVNSDVYDDRSIKELYLSTRYRRSSKATLSAIRAGRDAVQTLLEGTKQTRDGKTFREFLKIGSYRRAMSDFYKVRPNNVREKFFSNGVYKKTGDVGDRILTLTSRGADGKPTLEIVKRVEPGQNMAPAFERIRYFDKM